MRAALLMIALLGATACVPTSVAPPAPPADAPAVTQAAAPSDGLIGLINAARAQAGLPAASPDARMQAAAERHLNDMLANDFFGHAGTDGTNSAQRIGQAGITACQAAENIAFGTVSAQGVFDMWNGSGQHRANMLTPGAVVYGLAQGGGKTVLTVAQNC